MAWEAGVQKRACRRETKHPEAHDAYLIGSLSALCVVEMLLYTPPNLEAMQKCIPTSSM